MKDNYTIEEIIEALDKFYAENDKNKTEELKKLTDNHKIEDKNSHYLIDDQYLIYKGDGTIYNIIDDENIPYDIFCLRKVLVDEIY